MQGTVNSLSDWRKAASALNRVRDLLNSTRAEPQVEAAVPPGEWWLRSNRRAQYRRQGDDPALGSVDDVTVSQRRKLRPKKPGQPLEPVRTVLEPWIPDPGASTCPYPYRPMPDYIAAEHAATGDIVLDRVSFAYPMRAKKNVLQDVSITLRHGEVTALVGRSGAGKSTVASLLSRFYMPNTGTITMGGIDIHAWSRKAWTEAVALVSQEPALFSATVADNVAYGRPRASREEIEVAAKAANAHDFIVGLENGCVSCFRC
jgi:ABC-type multidrug transport system fused ATPase/permease subunit